MKKKKTLNFLYDKKCLFYFLLKISAITEFSVNESDNNFFVVAGEKGLHRQSARQISETAGRFDGRAIFVRAKVRRFAGPRSLRTALPHQAARTSGQVRPPKGSAAERIEDGEIHYIGKWLWVKDTRLEQNFCPTNHF